MVQEHVGKKRRKEVRQAINMTEEMRRLLLSSIGILVVGLVVVLLVLFLAYGNVIPVSPIVGSMLPLVILLVAIFAVTPRANRYWALRAHYKDHCRKFNISKADMQALKSEEN